MRIKFWGWKRSVFTHNHEVKPVKRTRFGATVSKAPTIKIADGTATISGKISSVGLSGDFLLDLTLSDAEIEDIIRARVQADPVSSFKMLTRLQTEAFKQGVKSAKSSENRSDAA